MPDSYLARPGGQINPQRSMPGVRHLSEELIKSTVKDTPLDSITILKLNFSELSGKRIRVIENLEKLKRLHTLNLAHNAVEKLERLETLVRLKDLDVSHNRITKIEGLERLVNLVSLNLEGNGVETVPVWIAKKLKSLRNVRLASNNIISLQELRKLRGLPNLTFLSVAHNPICELPHYRLYLIFHLRSLDVLDGRRISADERIAAAQRFDQEEIEALHAEVNEMQYKFDRLQEDHNKSLHDLETSHQNDSQLLRATRENEKRVRDMQAELNAKEDMIGRKQAELGRANQKHYELEQELAFYKIDTKFTSLHKKPDTPSGADDAESLMESPYIGKSQHAKDRPQWPASLRPPNKKRQHPKRDSDTSPDSFLDSELEHRQQEIDRANRKLADLADQLEHTEQRVSNAAEHLVKLADLKNRSREPLPEREREDLEAKLDTLQQTIDELQNNREQLLDNLDKNAADISEAEQNIDDLDKSLDSSDLEDSEKEALLIERDDREAFLGKAKEMRDDLEQALGDLEQVLEQKKAEASDLDDQLAGAEGLGSEPHPDIHNVAEEVKTILTSMKQGQPSASDSQAIRARLADLEKIAEDKEKARQQLERSLQEEKSANLLMREQLENSQRPDSPTKAEMEADVKKLMELKGQLEQQLRNQGNATPDQQIKKQLSKLQKENDKLKRDGELSRSLGDAEMMSKLDAMIGRAQAGQPIAANLADPVERRLAALQKTVDRDRKQAEKDAKKLREENSRLQEKMASLTSALSEETKSKRNDSSDSESAALVDLLKNELEDIRAHMAGEDNLKRQLEEANDRLKKAQAELERSKQMSRATDQPRHSPTKFNRYAVPPQFDLDVGLDDSYDDSESTRDTVRQVVPAQSRRPASRYDDRDRGTPGQRSVSQNSGRATDENPRLAAPPKQSTARVPPHPDDVMSIQSEVPVPYGQPRYPDSADRAGGGNKAGRSSDKKWAPNKRGLGTVPETYESDPEHPRQGPPKATTETRKMQQELAKADDEIARLQQILSNRDRDLDDTLRRTDAAEDVIERQRDEADTLRRELEQYKQEVDRLAALLANQGRLGEDGLQRISNLQGDVHQADQRAMSIMGQPPLLPAVGQPASLDPQLSASFIQGPTFRPGQLSNSPTGQGQMMTSTPYRGYPQPLQQPGQQANQPTVLGQYHAQPQVNPPQQAQLTLPANQLVQGQPIGQPGAYSIQSQSMPNTITLPHTGHYQTGTQANTAATVTLVPADAGPVVTLATTRSTAPTKTVILNTSASTTPVRSILKTSERNGFVCTLPEHHGLEDQHARLREKYKALKSTLKRNSADHKEERKVVGHMRAATELKHALKERRGELESLDLAINMQREQLHTLKSNWRLARKDKTASARQLSTESEGEEGRLSEIEHYMNTELQCLEETLSKRRAELREADKRLVDCRNSLELVKDEAEQMIAQYDLVKGQLDTMQTEMEVLGNSKSDREEQVAQLMVNVKKLAGNKGTLQQRIEQIEDVTTERDAYFNSLSQRIQQSETVLSELQTSIRQQTVDAEQHLHEIKLEAERHLASVRQSETELSEHYGDIRDIKSVDRRTELGSLGSLEREMKDRLEGRKDLLDKVKDKIEDEKEALQTLTIAVEQKEDQLSVLKKSLTSARAESAELLREISERRCLLESLAAESNVVERELNELRAKHAEGRQLLDKLEAALSEMSNTQQRLESQIRDKTAEYEQLQSRMRQLQTEVDDIKFDKSNSESQLQSVSQSLREQKTTAAKLKKIMKDMEAKRDSLAMECESEQKKRQEVEQQLNQLKYEYQQMSNGLMEAKTELHEQQVATDELRQDVCRLNEERSDRQRGLKELTSQYDRESQQLTDMTERAERELSHMRGEQQVCETRVGELTRELSRLMSEINKSRKEHGDVTELRAKLQQAESELEAERTTNADLMRRLTEFAQRLQTRNDSLTKVKKQSDGHINSLSEELSQVKKECKGLREKREAEVEDLEWIAQQHAQRADRLDVELTAARDQVELLKKSMLTLELQAGTDGRLVDTISHLRQDIQQEVTTGMAELEKSRAEAVTELDQLRAQKTFITNEVISLKENLNKVQTRQLDCQRPSRVQLRSPSPRKSAAINVRRKLDAEQEIIRRKMQEQMQRHMDSMEGMKTHSMSILTDLKDRVSSLQGVLSESTSSIHNTPSPPHRPVRDTNTFHT